MKQSITRQAIVPVHASGQRLDQAAATLFPDFSRARLQRWIREGRLTVNGETCVPRLGVMTGDELRLEAEPEPAGEWLPTAMALSIVYEDQSILVVDKPVGLVVHPAAGHLDDTLLNGLLAHCPEIEQVPRAGIVHRLDRDTSGLMVVAKTLSAQTRLVAAIQAREMSREYRAVVSGVVISGATIDKPMGRHPRDRQRMAVVANGGKSAITHYRVLERYQAHSLLGVHLDTGRTHQIRVHLASIGFPIVGDPVYAGRARLPRGASGALVSTLQAFRRQALHACRLRFAHPVRGEMLDFAAPLPEDMRLLIAELEADHRSEC